MDHLSRIRAWQFLRGVCISALNVHIPSRNPTGYLAYEFVDNLSPYPLGLLRETIINLNSQLSFHDDKPSEFCPSRFVTLLNCMYFICFFYLHLGIYHLVMVRVIGGIFLSTSVTPEIPNSGVFMTFLVRHLTLLGLLEKRKATQPVVLSPPGSMVCCSPLLLNLMLIYFLIISSSLGF